MASRRSTFFFPTTNKAFHNTFFNSNSFIIHGTLCATCQRLYYFSR